MSLLCLVCGGVLRFRGMSPVDTEYRIANRLMSFDGSPVLTPSNREVYRGGICAVGTVGTKGTEG